MSPLNAKSIGEFARLVREREECNQGKWSKKIKYSQGMISQVETDWHKEPYDYLRALIPYLTRNEIRHMQFLCYRQVDKNLRLG